MTGSCSSPPGGSKDDPSGNNRTPGWMRRADEIDTTVLVLRRKITNEEENAKETKKQEEENAKETKKQEGPLSNPFIVGVSIELCIGEKEARTVKAVREARGSRYLLRTNSRTIADKLKKMTQLTDGTEVEIISHPTLNTVQGTVYDPDSMNVAEKEIEGYLNTQGVHSVRRIKKRVDGILHNTPLLVLTFRGTCLPKYVYFGVLRIPVRTYYPSPMICFNCGAYGHSGKSCQQCGICLQCSKQHTLAQGQQCQNPKYCFHCKDGHAIISRECPKYKMEEKIVRIKVDQGISYPEARRIFAEENRKDTFSNVFQERLNKELAAKDLLIGTLQKQVAALMKELSALKEIIKPRSQSQSPAPSKQRSSSSQQNPSAQNSTPASTKPASPPKTSTDRLSRRDKPFISPPSDWRDKQKTDKSKKGKYDIQTRSKSGKRPMEISPTSNDSNRGERFPTQADDDAFRMDE